MKSSLTGKTVLITAGPTREYIDPVRCISNNSSGQMGFSLAKTAQKMGAKVILISGPVNILPPKGVRYIRIISAQDMFSAVKKYYKYADIIIMSAAVADWKPAKYLQHKIKKTYLPRPKRSEAGALRHLGTYALQLTPTPDILQWLGQHKLKGQFLIGFALETEKLIQNAAKKLQNKACDIIIANRAGVIGKDSASVTILSKDGWQKKIANRKKEFIAREILCPKKSSLSA